MAAVAKYPRVIKPLEVLDIHKSLLPRKMKLFISDLNHHWTLLWHLVMGRDHEHWSQCTLKSKQAWPLRTHQLWDHDKVWMASTFECWERIWAKTSSKAGDHMSVGWEFRLKLQAKLVIIQYILFNLESCLVSIVCYKGIANSSEFIPI